MDTATKLCIFTPPKLTSNTLCTVFLHSHNSTSRRRKPKLVCLSLLPKPAFPKPASSTADSDVALPKTASPADFDVISTHEHSDGSVLFRFGDPSEVEKSRKSEELVTVQEDTGKEDIDGHSVVKDLDGDHERQVTVKKVGSKKVADEANLTVTRSENSSVVEVEEEFTDDLFEDTEIVESSVSVSSVETQDSFSLHVAPEAVGPIEEVLDEKYEDESESTSIVEGEEDSSEKILTEAKIVESPVSESCLERKDSSSSNVSLELVEPIKEELGDSESTSIVDGEEKPSEVSSEDTKVLESSISVSSLETKESSGPEIIEPIEEKLDEKLEDDGESISIVDGEEKPELEDEKVLESPVSVSSVGKKDDYGPLENLEIAEHIEEELDEKNEDEISSVESEAMLDDSSKVENGGVELESPEEKSSDEEMLVQSESEDATQESTFEDIAATSMSGDVEEQNIGAERQFELVQDGTRSDGKDVMAMVSQLEKALSLSSENSDQSSEAGFPESGSQSETSTGFISPWSEAAKDFTEAGAVLQNEITEDGNESDKIEVVPVSSQLGSELTLDKEADDVEESADIDKTDGTIVERTEHINNVPKESSLDSSGQDMAELKPTESVDDSKENTKEYALSSGAAILPHPSKALTGGEDACFITGQTWLGIADGVSLWSFEGVNHGVYAKELIKNCENLVSGCDGDAVDNPVEVLNLSVAETQSPGSSTILISHLDGQALKVANIGDSGFMVLRDGLVHKKSSPMLQGFHFPLQIEKGHDPSCLVEDYKVDLEEGDVIITATDGLFDNLYDDEISSMVFTSQEAGKQPQEIAELLAARAQEVGSSSTAKTPFSEAAQVAGYAGYTGGKLDDVTVIISLVQRQ